MGCKKLTYSQRENRTLFLGIWKRGAKEKPPLFFCDALEKNPATPNFCNDYTPFGLTFGSYSSGTKNNYLYNQGTGDKTFAVERQSELGVDFTKFRVYDPALGRFWHVDPKADKEDQESWNPYHYSFNNPIRYNDPYGDCPTCDPRFRLFASKVESFGNYVADQFNAAVDNVVSFTNDAIENFSTPTGRTSSVVETATDEKVNSNQTKKVKVLNKASKIVGPVVLGASITQDALTTDFDDTEQVGNFVEKTAQNTLEATPLIGPGLGIIADEAKKEDGVTNTKNLSKNFSTMYDAQQKRTQERIERLRKSHTGSSSGNQNNQP